MALTKEELLKIQEDSKIIYKTNITEFFTMLLEKAIIWKARVL